MDRVSAAVPAETGSDGLTGRLISLAGIDGSGKTTQVSLLHAWLCGKGIRAVTSKTRLHAVRSFLKLSQVLYGDPYQYHPRIPADLRVIGRTQRPIGQTRPGPTGSLISFPFHT
jgi:hypothetical protein